MFVLLNDFQVHIVWSDFGHSDGGTSSTHDNDILDISIMLLAGYLADVGDILPCGHEIGEIVVLQYVIATRDKRLSFALDGHHMVRVIRSAQVFQGLVQYLASFAQLDTKHDEVTSMQVPALSYPRHLEAVGNVSCCKHLWKDE